MQNFAVFRTFIVKAAVVAACAGAFGACKADAPGTKPVEPDTTNQLTPPRAETASQTPLNTVVIQGTAISRKVLLRADASGLSQTVTTEIDGTYCAEFPLDDDASDTYSVYAVDEDGDISLPTTLTVEQDATAPEPSVVACSNDQACKTQEYCEGDATIDADCDGNVGECDTDCNGCIDDYFEPNDTPFSPPQIAKGTFALEICPCNMDYYTIPMLKNQTIKVTATFNNSLIDLDLYLQTKTNAEAQNTTYAAKAVSTSGTETFTYKATADGNYVLWVKVYDGQLGDVAPYTLKIE